MAVIQAQIPERLRGRVGLTFDLPASGNYPKCYAIWPTPTIGEFKDGRGEFYDTEPSGPGSKAILARFLVTLDVTNNFPQLPIRTDGPYLVWLGVRKRIRAGCRAFITVSFCDRLAQSRARVSYSRSNPPLAFTLAALTKDGSRMPYFAHPLLPQRIPDNSLIKAIRFRIMCGVTIPGSIAVRMADREGTKGLRIRCSLATLLAAGYRNLHRAPRFSPAGPCLGIGGVCGPGHRLESSR